MVLGETAYHAWSQGKHLPSCSRSDPELWDSHVPNWTVALKRVADIGLAFSHSVLW